MFSATERTKFSSQNPSQSLKAGSFLFSAEKVGEQETETNTHFAAAFQHEIKQVSSPDLQECLITQLPHLTQ